MGTSRRGFRTIEDTAAAVSSPVKAQSCTLRQRCTASASDSPLTFHEAQKTAESKAIHPKTATKKIGRHVSTVQTPCTRITTRGPYRFTAVTPQMTATVAAA